MKNQAALTMENNANENRLYLAIELSRKKWKLGINDGRTVRPRIRTIEARDFSDYVKRLSRRSNISDWKVQPNGQLL